MSKKHKSGQNKSAVLPAEVHPQEQERVRQLIHSQNSGRALDLAKEIHRRCHTAASEALILEAYEARFQSLIGRNLDNDAAALIQSVRERFPAAGPLLRQWNSEFAARRGDLSALLEPLNDPALPAAKLAEIAASVRRNVRDLALLAESPALAPEHPWRTAAALLRTAFQAVTTGPVSDQAIALPEISRSNPLAPWKMLIRAIAAYYRSDDALCAKCLAALEPDSAVTRLAPALRAMIQAPERGETLTPAAAALVKRTAGEASELRAVLIRLDAAFDGRREPSALTAIREAVDACRQEAPNLLERLKQHISVRASAANMKAEKVASALGRPCLKDAYFWRLLARSLEDDRGKLMSVGRACAAWEEFRKHAIRESWLPSQGPELASVYLHMAELLRPLGEEGLDELSYDFPNRFSGFANYYRDQPPEIRALMPLPGKNDLYYLHPMGPLERACAADPRPENFEWWMRVADEVSEEAADRVAELWSKAQPNDIPPLLRLMQSAEKRNALQKAFKLMERAERIDGVNSEVRRARLRLLVAITVRHLREKKAALADKDLAQIEALPQSRQGERPILIAALRYAWCELRGARQEADAAYAEIERLLGDAATAELLRLQIANWCRVKYPAPDKGPKPGTSLTAAIGRICAMSDDVGLQVAFIDTMWVKLMAEARAPHPTVAPRALLALGEAAMRYQNEPLAYLLSGDGLEDSPEYRGRFLFLRARALPPWEAERQSSCLAAASELARRLHDSGLSKEIGQWRKDEADWLSFSGAAPSALDTAEIEALVAKEMAAGLPTMPEYDEDNFEDDWMTQLPPELREMADQLGPDAMAQVLAQVIEEETKKGKRRGRRRIDDGDLPF